VREGKRLNRDFLEREFDKRQLKTGLKTKFGLMPINKIIELHELYSAIIKNEKGYPPSSKEWRSEYFNPVHAFRAHFEKETNPDYAEIVKHFANFNNFENLDLLKKLKGKIEELASPVFYKAIKQAGRMRGQASEPSEKLLQEIKAALVWNVFQHCKFPKKF